MNLLVVEDQTVVRELLFAVASSAYRGAIIKTAADLEEALLTAATIPIDAVLLDLGLPGCRGIEARSASGQPSPRFRLL